MSARAFGGPPPESEPGIGALTLGGFLGEVASSFADNEAIAFREPGRSTAMRWSYRVLDGESWRVAKALVAAGLTKGTRVGVLMGNRPEWVACAFGVALAGGVLVPINTYLEAPELKYVLLHSDASFLLMQQQIASHDLAQRIDKVFRSLPSAALPFMHNVVCLGTESWDEFLSAGAEVDDGLCVARAHQVTPYDDALMVYTSGTTARPKGVLHCHRSPCIQAWRFAQHLGLDQQVRAWSAFPFFWTAGFCMVMGATLAAGGCLVLEEHFDPGEALRLLEAERVTSPQAWPHQLAAMEDHPDWARRDLSALRHVDSDTSFGRHPSVKLESTWSPRAAYGLTETFTIISSYPANTQTDERADSQGPILPGNVVRVIDVASREPRGVSELGEITVKGPTLMRGYVKVAPEECFDADGFFHTGDAGYVDEQNRLHWTGRITEMIKTGGANVSPVEVEEALLPHPGLKVARVVGVPDSALGEMVVLCAVAHDRAEVDEAGVRGFLMGKVAPYKIPRRVLFFEEGEVALTGNAKVRPEELRALALSRLGVGAPVGKAPTGENPAGEAPRQDGAAG